MAEATLAVAIDPMTSPWSSTRVDSDALAAGDWHEVAEGGTELVSCGPPVRGTEVRTSGGGDVGELEIRSGSLLDGYVGDEASPLTDDGWLHTADLGHMRDGNVYIAGRSDDVLIVAGRNIDARAMDALVAAHPACRPGNTACVPDGSGRYVVVAEPRTAAMEPAELRAGARDPGVPGPAVRREPIDGGLHRAGDIAEDAERKSAPEPPARPVVRGQARKGCLGLKVAQPPAIP